MLRRRFYLGVVAVLTGSAGCQDRDATPIPETAVDPETDAGDTPTIRVEDGDPEPGTVTDSGLESYLPDGHAVAASTGTEQRTFTPEVPPTMTQSPVPGTEDRVRELLALSPRLGTADIDENRVHC
jgi:hypothetical protein